MRSVFVHLWNTSERDVAAALDRLFPTQGRPWAFEVNDDPCLYIDFYRDGHIEDEDWLTRFSARGGPPAVSVIANISGRHEGSKQASQFVTWLLSEFEGVTTDDDWLHLWTLEEVQNDLLVDGKKFGSWRE